MQRATHFRFSISRLIFPSYFSLFLSFYNCLSLIFLIFSIMIQCNDIVTIEIPSKIQSSGNHLRYSLYSKVSRNVRPVPMVLAKESEKYRFEKFRLKRNVSRFLRASFTLRL